MLQCYHCLILYKYKIIFLRVWQVLKRFKGYILSFQDIAGVGHKYRLKFSMEEILQKVSFASFVSLVFSCFFFKRQAAFTFHNHILALVQRQDVSEHPFNYKRVKTHDKRTSLVICMK